MRAGLRRAQSSRDARRTAPLWPAVGGCAIGARGFSDRAALFGWADNSWFDLDGQRRIVRTLHAGTQTHHSAETNFLRADVDARRLGMQRRQADLLVVAATDRTPSMVWQWV